MLCKIWKKVCILILIIACLFNIVSKLVKRVTFNKEALTSAEYMLKQLTGTAATFLFYFQHKTSYIVNFLMN